MSRYNIREMFLHLDGGQRALSVRWIWPLPPVANARLREFWAPFERRDFASTPTGRLSAEMTASRTPH